MITVIGRGECGCEVRQDNDASVYITYCPKHAAAPDLYQACGFAMRQIETWREGGVLDKQYSNLALESLKEALAKAEGK